MVSRPSGAKLRDRVIARYGQNCNWCGCETIIVGNRPGNERTPGNGFTVDHLIPLAKGGDNAIGNLRPSCYTCNLTKGDEIWDEDGVEATQKGGVWSGATTMGDLLRDLIDQTLLNVGSSPQPTATDARVDLLGDSERRPSERPR